MEKSEQIPPAGENFRGPTPLEAMSDLNATSDVPSTCADGAVDSEMCGNSSYVWNVEVINSRLSRVRTAFNGGVVDKRMLAWEIRSMLAYTHYVPEISHQP